jgi:hypothetical protein
MLTDDELGVRLRTRLDEELAGITAASDLTESLRRRARRTTAVRASVVAGLTLVTAAVGVAALSGGGGTLSPQAGPDPSTEPPVYDVTYVAAQTDGALANATDFIVRAEYTIASTGYSYVDTMDLLTLSSRYDNVAPDGSVKSIAIIPKPGGPGTWDVLVVDHEHQAWWTHPFATPTLPDGTTAAPSPPRYYDPAEIRDALTSGEATLLGVEEIDGRDAWHLRIDVYRLDDLAATLDLYVDPETYLPLRIVTAPAQAGRDPVAVDLTWLPRTDENLALVELPIPDGYTYREGPVLPEPGLPVG